MFILYSKNADTIFFFYILERGEIIVNQGCVDVTVNIIKSCTNTPVKINAIAQSLIVKIPVVLAQFNVHFSVSG